MHRNFYDGVRKPKFSTEEILYYYPGSPLKLCKQHSSCTARSSFFTESVVDIWNSLPVDTQTFHHVHILFDR